MNFILNELDIDTFLPETCLQNSLVQIYIATEKIWSNEAPRIIKDYTNHGIDHSKRVIKKSFKLLEANNGRLLSNIEKYLLLSSILLHDIGMQCDIIKFPEIKKRAEELGAKFDIEFISKTSSSFNIEEQNEIRKNHQYLTAAWIDFAFKSGDTVLGNAIKSIPEKIISDLMDICKFHAKLPISNCPQNLMLYPKERKQFIAAILRFSDELDITEERVDLETVKNFRLNPRNSVYWWLHSRTTTSFLAKNVISILIQLHPKDKKEFGSIIHDLVINKFQTKNRPVLDILHPNGIEIFFSSDSGIVADESAETLPKEIKNALRSMTTNHDPLIDLTEEIRTWLQAIRYEVSEYKFLNQRMTEMLASFEKGTFKQKVLVRCIDGEIEVSDLSALDSVLDRQIPQGWLISDKRISANAIIQNGNNNSIEIFTLSDFIEKKVWTQYFSILTSSIEKKNIQDYYVDLGCYKCKVDENGNEIIKDRYNSLDEYINNWLMDRCKVHISLLGEFGAGKTWFCNHYAYEQLKKYLKDPVRERLPLLITLRSFSKAMTSTQLINDALLEEYKLPFVGSAFEVFKEMNRKGKLLLILDGFDEMAKQVDYQTIVNNFWELAELIDKNSKVILTSRTEYFRRAKESEKIFSGKEYGRNNIDLAPPKFEVLNLEVFTDEQIKKVITRRLGIKKGIKTFERIKQNINLSEMARKPVLVKLLLEAMDEIDFNILENPSQIYLYATNKLLLRNIEKKNTFTKTSDKLFFLCELAWEMLKEEKIKIHYTEIPNRIKKYFNVKISDQHQLDIWDVELRNQTLLHRDAAGYYEFAYRSMAEYFVAFKFAAELGCLENIYSQTYFEADDQKCVLPFEKKNITELATSFGLIKLSEKRMDAVFKFVLDMMSKNSFEQLLEIVNKTKYKNFQQVKFSGGNAVSLLSKTGFSFVNIDFSQTVLVGSNFFETNLLNTKFEGCDLTDTDLSDSQISEEVLNKAKINKTKISIYISGNTNQLINYINYSQNKLENNLNKVAKKNKKDFNIDRRIFDYFFETSQSLTSSETTSFMSGSMKKHEDSFLCKISLSINDLKQIELFNKEILKSNGIQNVSLLNSGFSNNF